MDEQLRSFPRFDTATVGEWCSYASRAEQEILRLTKALRDIVHVYYGESTEIYLVATQMLSIAESALVNDPQRPAARAGSDNGTA
ncbi:MAG: hypothetical protein WB992_04785 [Bryobacteraceae bacterium]